MENESTIDALEIGLLERLRGLWEMQLFEVAGHWITPGKIVIAVLVMLIGALISGIVSRRGMRLVLNRLKIGEGPAQAIQNLIYYSLLVVALLIALQVAGVPITVFTFFGGALALGIGFGSQNLVNNFMCGLVLLIERPVRVGDLVEIDGVGGRVANIGARCTTISDYTGVAHLVPNSTLLENRLTNWSLHDDLVVVPIAVGVAYGSDTTAVRELLLDAAAAHDRVVDQPSPQVLFQDFGDNALHFELLVWIHARASIERMRCASDLRYAIDTACRERGVVIAFPQRDVHLDAGGPLPVRVVDDGEGA